MDREKVIIGLEGMIDYFFDIYRNDTDSYKCAKAQEYSDVAIDAIALLKEQEEQIKNRDESLEKAREEIKWLRGMIKEQEAVKPITDKLRNQICPKCNTVLKGKYCHECGKHILWEGR